MTNTSTQAELFASWGLPDNYRAYHYSQYTGMQLHQEYFAVLQYWKTKKNWLTHKETSKWVTVETVTLSRYEDRKPQLEHHVKNWIYEIQRMERLKP